MRAAGEQENQTEDHGEHADAANEQQAVMTAGVGFEERGSLGDERFLRRRGSGTHAGWVTGVLGSGAIMGADFAGTEGVSVWDEAAELLAITSVAGWGLGTSGVG